MHLPQGQLCDLIEDFNLYLALCLALLIWIHQLASEVSCCIRSHNIKLFDIFTKFSVYSYSFVSFMCLIIYMKDISIYRDGDILFLWRTLIHLLTIL